MELLGILVFIFGLASNFYKDYQEKKKEEEKRAAKRFDASNEPSKMSQNGVNQQRRQGNQRNSQKGKKPKTLADYLAKAQTYLDEVDADSQKTFEELKAEKMKSKHQAKQGRNAGRQNRGQEFAAQSQAMRAEQGQHQHARLNQSNNSQQTVLTGEGEGRDDSAQFSQEGRKSNEGYFDQEMAANDLELGKALQQMDAMYDQQAERLDEELNRLFKDMDDPNKDLSVSKDTKKKSRNAREILALSSQDDLKRGILLKEILDKPVAKRHQA